MYKPSTLADVARRIRQLGPDEPRDAWVCIRDFLDDWYAADAEAHRQMLGAVPPPTGDSRFDAYLAALAEHFAVTEGLPVPPWSQTTNRFLDEWWFPTQFKSLHAMALVESPAAFRRRGVFIDSTAFMRV